MKTQVHPNSITAYHGINLTKRQAEVVRALKQIGDSTDEQIAKFLSVGINRVTGRIAELKAKGVVIEMAAIMGDYGKKVRVNRLVNYGELF